MWQLARMGAPVLENSEDTRRTMKALELSLVPETRLLVDPTANPAPLGLLGFGMTTVLLNFHNLGLFGLDTMILGMGLCSGGLCQILAGLLEWKKGNTFGMTAFTSYGAFWLSLVTLVVLPKLGLGEAPSELAMAAYLALWGLFTAGFFLATLRLSRALQVVFASLTLLFGLLALGDLTGNMAVKHWAGAEGIFCGGSAMYAGLGQLLNEVYRRTVVPLG